ncbi:MAG: hypothetical protein JWQ54_3795 [Mucilaginibacter sp.]|nr:hypothetical protein [Mucilaginibacter sp.]
MVKVLLDNLLHIPESGGQRPHISNLMSRPDFTCRY